MSCNEPTVFWIGEKAKLLHKATCPLLMKNITRIMGGDYRNRLVHSYAYCRDNRDSDYKGPWPPEDALLHRCLSHARSDAQEGK